MKNELKKKLLTLREEGKTYCQIQDETGLSRATISYHCSISTKERVLSYQTGKRMASKRGEKFSRKTSLVKFPNVSLLLKSKIRKFRTGTLDRKKKFNLVDSDITIQQVIDKFEANPFCYLTGETLTIDQRDLSLDHIIPVSRGGTNSLENLGFTTYYVNRMKNNMTKEELLDVCKKLIEFNK